MKIYTRTGDRGTTALFGGRRVPKDDPRIEAYGTVDELNSCLGAARATAPTSSLDGLLESIQRDLFDIGAQLAAPDSDRFAGVRADRVAELEGEIDRMEEGLEPLRSFILPGGCAAAAQLHVARTICRRAERRVVALGDESATTVQTIAYLNRLADLLFVAARFANAAAGVPDIPWSRQ